MTARGTVFVEDDESSATKQGLFYFLLQHVMSMENFSLAKFAYYSLDQLTHRKRTNILPDPSLACQKSHSGCWR